MVELRACDVTSPSLDPWDPNNWAAIFAEEDARHVRVYLDNDGREFVWIDAIDWPWVSKHCWCAKRDPNGNIYARRAVGENAFGNRLRTYTKYLHVEIMKATGRKPRSSAHRLVDHRNGNTLDNRRANLRWATHSMNGHNQWGRAPADLIEG